MILTKVTWLLVIVLTSYGGETLRISEPFDTWEECKERAEGIARTYDAMPHEPYEDLHIECREIIEEEVGA